MVMLCIRDAFVQSTYFVTPIHTRLFLHPKAPGLITPTGETWKAFNDRIFSAVPGTIVLAMLTRDLERQLNEMALQHLTGWIFNAGQTLEVSQLLERASLRYTALTRGVVADELSKALTEEFEREPAFMQRLSDCNNCREAVRDVVRRVVSQMRFTWELDKVAIADAGALGLRLIVELHDAVFSLIENHGNDIYLMPSTRFKHFVNVYNRLEQFMGLDARFDRLLCAYKNTLAHFPKDGRSLFGSDLNDFWQQLAELLKELEGEIQEDFFGELELEEADFDMDETLEEEDVFDIFSVESRGMPGAIC